MRLTVTRQRKEVDKNFSIRKSKTYHFAYDCSSTVGQGRIVFSSLPLQCIFGQLIGGKKDGS